MAGFVDAVVGGGGLVQLPALLLALPSASPVQVLATNKIASVCGTAASSATYYRRLRPDPRTFGPLMLLALVGAFTGALAASQIPRQAFEPLVLVALVAVGTYVVARPRLGESTQLRFAGRRHLATAMLVGFVIGLYDGVLGPGTGSFFVFVLVGLMGYDFLQASAKAKLANLATNVGALLLFIPTGAVLWDVGLLMGAANLAGGYLGARTAVARGAGFVRAFFIVVVGGFIVRIGGGVLGVW
ncbi:TSUP family transporter [Nocardioides sp. zg-536]|uniref:Probable membrane transporter protein n=2 Tax=Nocardioides faecalis TaxID=2803858 RepID=A0A938Y5E9_9ACTN|nr:TSUP family transporter [Nocardioides faecalis]QVI60687.1 TSUP family transporter [Nocardioides faecalis]